MDCILAGWVRNPAIAAFPQFGFEVFERPACTTEEQDGYAIFAFC